VRDSATSAEDGRSIPLCEATALEQGDPSTRRSAPVVALRRLGMTQLSSSVMEPRMPPSDLDALFERFRHDAFRRKFVLRGRELAYLQTWGIDKVLRDARELISARVAPAEPKNDGRQTPWKNHPVFVAQHATATCCRGCVEKWHGIPKGAAFSESELHYVLSVIDRYLRQYL
jgi:hypothetical protein